MLSHLSPYIFIYFPLLFLRSYIFSINFVHKSWGSQWSMPNSFITFPSLSFSLIFTSSPSSSFNHFLFLSLPSSFYSHPYSVTSKKLPNVYKSCPRIISLGKLKILTPLQKLPKNVGDLGKLIVATGFEKLPKVQ